MGGICRMLIITSFLVNVNSVTEEDHGVKYANKCEGKDFCSSKVTESKFNLTFLSMQNSCNRIARKA